MGEEAIGNEATPEQLESMKQVLGESIAAGGLGFSTTLSRTHSDGDGKPVASRWATTEEIVALCRVVGEHEGTTLEGMTDGCLDRFSDEEIDLERKGLRRHLAFGVGSHHCLGAPLARREMYYGFKALVDRVERLWFVEGANDFSHHQNFLLRALKEVHVGFEPVENWSKSGADRSADTREG